MKVAITGAGGFIGRHLAVRMAAAGHELTLVDQVAHPTLPTMVADYGEPRALEALGRQEVVLHLAAVSGIVACEQDPVRSRRVNISALCALADRLQSSATPLLFASSFAVMGEPATQPIRPDHPFAPMNEYGRQKVAGEMVARSLGPRGFVLRMSNVYGHYAIGSTEYRKGNVISLFAQQAASGSLRIHAPGTQARDFIHIEDVVRYWMAAAEYAVRPGADTAAFHLASGDRWSVRELATEFRRRAGRPIREEVVTNPRVEALLDTFEVDTTSTRERLGVRPAHTVRETIGEELGALALPR